MKLKFVDVVLVVVITGSLALIGWKLKLRLVDSTKSDLPVAVGRSTTPEPNSSSSLMRKQQSQPLFERANAIDDAAWSGLRTQLKDRTVVNSIGCTNAAPDASGIAFLDTDVKKLVREGRLRTVWARGKFYCYKKGKELLVFTNGKAPSDPALQPLGTAEIEDIVTGPVVTLPEALFTAFGVERKFFEKLDTSTPDGSSAFVFLRLKPLKPVANLPPYPPVPFPKTRVVRRKSLVRFLEANPNDIVVDIRSRGEFERGHLPRAINIPFEFSNRRREFSWSMTVGELREVSFPIGNLLESKSHRIVVYGKSRGDGGGIWAIMKLQEQGFSDLVWVADGLQGQ